MSALPDLPALSIRQPWAWLIVRGHKDVENRDWATGFRGRFLVHAAKGMTRGEYLSAHAWVARVAPEISLPAPGDLERGGIVGVARLVDCVRESASPWFCGRWGFVLRQAERLEFTPCRGALGFFRVEVCHA